jgi:hypothetical protein
VWLVEVQPALELDDGDEAVAANLDGPDLGKDFSAEDVFA